MRREEFFYGLFVRMRKENSDVTELTDERFVAESRKAQIDGLWDENILLRKYISRLGFRYIWGPQMNPRPVESPCPRKPDP